VHPLFKQYNKVSGFDEITGNTLGSTGPSYFGVEAIFMVDSGEFAQWNVTTACAYKSSVVEMELKLTPDGMDIRTLTVPAAFVLM
jgi:hypothetical protein